MIVSLRPYSPKKVTGYVRPLLEYLRLDSADALLLPLSQSVGFVAEVSNCHLNVWCQTRGCLGTPQHGWQLAQDPRYKFGEAIFHTVWRMPSGELRDITPRADGEKLIMFVPDSARTIELASYEGRPAINTFSSVKAISGEVVEPLKRIQIVMQSDFAERHGLWPW